jgi:hypothetical protein
MEVTEMQNDNAILGELSAEIMRVKREHPELKSGLKVLLVNAVQEMG